MRSNFFDTVFDFADDVVSLGFGRPENLAFNVAGTKDVFPSRWSEMENEEGYKCVCRTVGIDPEDVEVTLNDNKIHVSGETEFEGVKYDTRYDLPLSRDILSNIKNIKFKSLNGLTYIYVYVDRHKNEIVAERI